MQTDRGSTVNAVGELFLQASLEPSRWVEALDAMASATRSLRGQLLGIDSRGELVFNFVTQIDDAFNADFLSVPGQHDPMMNYRVAASAAPGKLVFEEHYDRVRAVSGPTPYEELCEKHGLPFGCQTALSQEQGTLTGLALLRTRREGPTTAEDRAFFAAVAPSARAAARLQIMIESQGASLAQGALDAVAAPALLVDGYRRVIEMTPAAERVLASTSRLNVRGKSIVASTRPQTAEIEAALASVLRRKRVEAAVVLRGGGEPPLSLAIQALPQAEWQMGFRPCAIVVLKGVVAEPSDLRQALRLEFGLTDSEADIALSLAACMPRERIADLRGTSLGTVRQQIKAIFAKLGVSREVEFMGLIAAFTRG